jgi:hypothetical protein
VVRARQIATKHVRGDRFASLVWAVIWVAGLLAFIGVSIGGAFAGPDAVAGEVVLGVLLVLMVWATVSDVPRQNRTLASLAAPPQLLRLTSERARKSSSARRVTFHDRSGENVVGTARTRRPRPLTSLSIPVAVLVFGEVAPGGRVVCVEPRLGLVTTCRLDRLSA